MPATATTSVVASSSIAFGTSVFSNSCDGNGSNTCTYSFNMATGTNPFLTCESDFHDVPGTVSMTWNGVSMKHNGSQVRDTGASWKVTSDVFVLTAPASGTNNLVITTANTMPGYGNADFWVGCMSYSGVDQTTGTDTNQTSGSVNAASSLSTTITSAADNDWQVSWFSQTDGRTCNISSPGTSREGRCGSGIDTGGTTEGTDSNGAIHPAGSNTITLYSTGGNQDLNDNSFFIMPAPY